LMAGAGRGGGASGGRAESSQIPAVTEVTAAVTPKSWP
jgi:hypothetical protein